MLYINIHVQQNYEEDKSAHKYNNIELSAGSIRRCFGAYTRTCISDSGSLLLLILGKDYPYAVLQRFIIEL